MAFKQPASMQALMSPEEHAMKQNKASIANLARQYQDPQALEAALDASQAGRAQAYGDMVRSHQMANMTPGSLAGSIMRSPKWDTFFGALREAPIRAGVKDMRVRQGPGFSIGDPAQAQGPQAVQANAPLQGKAPVGATSEEALRGLTAASGGRRKQRTR